MTKPKKSTGGHNKALENSLADALDRIAYLEERIDGIKLPKKQPETLSLSAIKNEILQNIDERHEIISEDKQGIEKRLKQLERRITTMNEEQKNINLELKSEIDNISRNPDPLFNTQDIDKKMKQMDQKRRKDNQNIQDDLMDLIDQKFLVVQQERVSKMDRIIREFNEINRRVDIHDDDMEEITKVIQELDRDRIQDGKTSELLKQKYDLLDERIENLSEAVIEVNTIMTKTSKTYVDINDLNVIKEACLQDFNTLNERINDVGETVDMISKRIISLIIRYPCRKK